MTVMNSNTFLIFYDNLRSYIPIRKTLFSLLNYFQTEIVIFRFKRGELRFVKITLFCPIDIENANSHVNDI